MSKGSSVATEKSWKDALRMARVNCNKIHVMSELVKKLVSNYSPLCYNKCI